MQYLWIHNGILHLTRFPQLIRSQVLFGPQGVVVPSLPEEVQVCLQTGQEHKVAAEEVDTAADIQLVLLFQSVQDVVEHVGYSRPYITPEPLNSVEFSNNNDLTTIILKFISSLSSNYIPSFNINLLFKLQMTCLWLCTLLPAMKVPCSGPRTDNIRRATPTFSPPWSARTLQNNKTHFW